MGQNAKKLTETQTILVSLVTLIIVAGVITAGVLLAPNTTQAITPQPSDHPLVPTMTPTDLRSFKPLGFQLANVVTPVFLCTPSTVTTTPTPTPLLTDNIDNSFGRFAVSRDVSTLITQATYEKNIPDGCNNRPLVYTQTRGSEWSLLSDTRLPALGTPNTKAGIGTQSEVNRFSQAAAVSQQGSYFALSTFSNNNENGQVLAYRKVGGSYEPGFDIDKVETLILNPTGANVGTQGFFGKALLFVDVQDTTFLLVSASADRGRLVQGQNPGIVFVFKVNPDTSLDVPLFVVDTSIGSVSPPEELASPTFGQSIDTNNSLGVLVTSDPILRTIFIFHRINNTGPFVSAGTITETPENASEGFGVNVAIDSDPFTKIVVSDSSYVNSTGSRGKFHVYKLVTPGNSYQLLQVVPMPLTSSPSISAISGFSIRMAATRDLKALVVSQYITQNTDFQNFAFVFRLDVKQETYYTDSEIDPQFIPLPTQSNTAVALHFAAPSTLLLITAEPSHNRIAIYVADNVFATDTT